MANNGYSHNNAIEKLHSLIIGVIIYISVPPK